MKTKVFTVRFMARVAIFSAIAAILYCVPFLKFKLPFFLSFLEIHFDEIPAFVASFAYGPLCGSLVLVIKTLIKLPFTSTATVGEWLDLLYGLALILPASIIYKKHRTYKGAIIGIIASIFAQLLVSFICAGTFVINFYAALFHIEPEKILKMGQALNPNVKNIYFSMAFYCFLPFNAFKDAIIAILTILLYPRVRYFTEKRYKK
ncbi:MAG: ECF transporter S component [Erysipelotrichales bacterium]|nr:ECF transporter S component [Erysipelotrichales bacterium]